MLLKVIILIVLNLSLSENSCIANENHCNKCNKLTKLCIQCDKDIYIPDEYGGCEYSHKCVLGLNQCDECDDSGKLCKKCTDGHFPDLNGGCSYTDNCEISYRGQCLKCKDNYALIGEESLYGEKHIKICKSLYSGDLKNCELINYSIGVCAKCKEGYYLNAGDNKCSKTENCYESVYETCTKCDPGYYLDKKEAKCKNQTDIFANCKESLDGKTCDVCNDFYYHDEEGKCTSFKYCLKSNFLKCEKCQEGYFLTQVGGVCVNTENCYSGEQDIGICSTCNDGYYLDYKDGKCKSNQEDNEFKFCRTADNGKCNQCILWDYYLGEDSKCSNTNNCAETNNGICIVCSDNYYLGLDNRCSDVEHCIYSNYYSCIECEDNYYYDVSNRLCLLAKDNFENCKSGYSKDNCNSCKNDFYLNQTDYKCYSNKNEGPFYKCSKTDSEAELCLECIEEYNLGSKDNKCTLLEGCATSEKGKKCLECDEYYCLDKKKGQCFMNDEIISEEKKFYFNCNETNEEGNRCQICNEGFTLNENGICINENKCEEKNEDGTCKKCYNNYEEGFYCLNKDFGCVEIYFSGINCLECNDNSDFYICTKCFDGYNLAEEGNCIK